MPVLAAWLSSWAGTLASGLLGNGSTSYKLAGHWFMFTVREPILTVRMVPLVYLHVPTHNPK